MVDIWAEWGREHERALIVALHVQADRLSDRDFGMEGSLEAAQTVHTIAPDEGLARSFLPCMHLCHCIMMAETRRGFTRLHCSTAMA
jgi:hypothetical protein